MHRQSATIASIAVLCLAPAMASIAQAQGQYPERAIRFIVPFAPGGTSDIVGRLIADTISKDVGQTVVVDNRGGAGATIGTRIAAVAPPDGYTLLIAHMGLAINETLHPGRGYEATRDLVGISLVGQTPSGVVVKNDLPVKSVKELIALARKKAGGLTYGSGGLGSTSHLSVELFQNVGDLKLVHVPFKGAGPAMVSLVGGEVDMAIPTLPSAIGHVRGGRIRLLAVTGEKRTSAAPDVPTVAEAGLPGYTYSTWYAVWTRAGTPKQIIARVNEAIVKGLKTAELREKLASQGVEPESSTPEHLTRLLHTDVERWAKIIKGAGIPLAR
jgi:tripartite-type tricarboxylate transporter receptor subunit TctC